MPEQGPEKSSVDPIEQQVNEATRELVGTLTAQEYNSESINNNFASVEMAVNRAAEAGLRTPLNIFGALKELSDAVAETAEAHSDEQTQKIFAARSSSYAATVRLLEQPSAEPTPPSSSSKSQPRRSRRSDTRSQQTSGAKK